MMGKKVIEYDPFTGITETREYDQATDTLLVYREQDVDKILDVSKALAKDDDYTKQGIKRGWWHYAIYPPILIEHWLRKFGVNVFDKHHARKVYQLTNQPEYKYLKTTSKLHELRSDP